MTPLTWSDAAADLAIALERAERAARKHADLSRLDGDAREDAELAIGKHLHDAYCAAEQAIERLIVTIDGELPRGSRFHQDLIDRAARPVEPLRSAMISPVTATELSALLRFRHVFRHAYGAFDFRLASPNVAVAARAMPRLVAELADFARRQGIEPAA